jgi:hypothetical protein
LVASTKYWIGIGCDNTVVRIYYDSPDANRAQYYTGGGTNLPATWANSGTNAAYRYSMYADYVAAGGVVSVDMWHPEIQQPVREKIEVIGY